MSISNAWLLTLGSSFQAAVGQHDMLHLIAAPTTFFIPQAPQHCQHTIIWQEKIIPLIDLEGWLQGRATDNHKKYIVIVTYQIASTLEYGALSLSTPPQRIQVDDSQSCSLPTEPILWQHIADACFKTENTAVPILNLTTIFHTIPEEY